MSRTPRSVPGRGSFVCGCVENQKLTQALICGVGARLLAAEDYQARAPLHAIAGLGAGGESSWGLMSYNSAVGL